MVVLDPTITIDGIASVIVTIVSAIVAGVSVFIANEVYNLQKNKEKEDKKKEKSDFLITVLKILDDNANRNARRRWFNTYKLNPPKKEKCLRQMNALRGVKDIDIPTYIDSNIIESRYKTLTNFELAAYFIQNYITNQSDDEDERKSKLENEILFQTYKLDFLSIYKMIENDKELQEYLKKNRYPNLNEFFTNNKNYLNNEAGADNYKGNLPFKDVEQCKEKPNK